MSSTTYHEPTLQQKKDNYYAVFYDRDAQPPRKWVALGTKRKAEANQLFADYRRKYYLDQFDPWKDSVYKSRTVREVIDLFLRAKAGLRDKTQQGYRDILMAFADTCSPAQTMASVSTTEIMAFVGRPHLADASQATYLRHLKVFLNWAYKHGHTRRDIVPELPKRRRKRRESHFLSKSQFQDLLAFIADDRGDPHYWLAEIIRFAAFTGLRRAELINLRWQDIEEEYVVVRNREGFSTKSGHDRRVPLIDEAEQVLERQRAKAAADQPLVFPGVKGGQLDGNYLSKRFRQYRKRAGLPSAIHFHSLRHTCASWLAMENVSLRIVQEILGHGDINVTQIYAHLAPDAMKSAMQDAFSTISASTAT